MEAIVKTPYLDEMNHVEDSTVELDTIYWHISITQETTERGRHQSKACDVGSLG